MSNNRQRRPSAADARGFALALAAVAIPVMLAMAVFVADFGLARVARGQLQAALDAAALAAVNDGGTVTVRNETVMDADIREQTWTFLTPSDTPADIARELPSPDRIVTRNDEEITHVECGQRGCATVHDGWRVTVRFITGYRETVRSIPGIDFTAAHVAAIETVIANAGAWRTTLGDRFRNLRIEDAVLTCEDPATGAATAFTGDCPGGGGAGGYRVRYRVVRGSVEYRTMLAGAVVKLLGGRPPDPWVTISLGDQEATVQLGF